MRKWWQTKRFYLLLCFVAFASYAYKVVELRYSDEAYKRQVQDNALGYEMQVNYYKVGERTMRYLEIGNDSLPMILLLHGSPSSSASWQGLLRDSLMLSNAYLVAVDRPGYGFSDFGDIETSIVKQAELIAPLLKEKREQFEQILVVGSSYGGPVAVRLAMEYPDLLDGIMLQSASVEPGAEKIYAASYPTSRAPLKWLMPTVFRNANAEKLSHEAALKEIEADWHKVKANVTIFHGKQDSLIYFSNALYAQKKLVNAKRVDLIAVEDGVHGMLWSKTELVKKTMLKALKRARN